MAKVLDTSSLSLQNRRMDNVRLMLGDCLERLRELSDNSVDSVVTDPPYGLSFMGKKWDYDVPSVDVWAECLRVLKPGGHLLAFAGTRTQHRMAVRIEDAGFEIRDMIAWVYGSGFPKSLDVSKAIDKAAGAEREVVGREANCGASRAEHGKAAYGDYAGDWNITAPATEAAHQWQGWGTALKPALEPITVARKPLEGTVAGNILKWHTGALNIDGCRVATTDLLGGGNTSATVDRTGKHEGWKRPWMEDPIAASAAAERSAASVARSEALGRWPANLIHDGSDEVVELFPVTTSGKPIKKIHTDPGRNVASGAPKGGQYFHDGYGDSGSAARFFYCAKTSKKDRNEGCEHLPEHQEGLQLPRGKCSDCGTWKNSGEEQCKCGGKWEMTSNPLPKARNNHPTVKPTDLMRYLCRLVTQPNGVVLDPFMGSGSTGKAAMIEGFQFIGIERDESYFEIARSRIEEASKQNAESA